MGGNVIDLPCVYPCLIAEHTILEVLVKDKISVSTFDLGSHSQDLIHNIYNLSRHVYALKMNIRHVHAVDLVTIVRT